MWRAKNQLLKDSPRKRERNEKYNLKENIIKLLKTSIEKSGFREEVEHGDLHPLNQSKVRKAYNKPSAIEILNMQ